MNVSQMEGWVSVTMFAQIHKDPSLVPVCLAMLCLDLRAMVSANIMNVQAGCIEIQDEVVNYYCD